MQLSHEEDINAFNQLMNEFYNNPQNISNVPIKIDLIVDKGIDVLKKKKIFSFRA